MDEQTKAEVIEYIEKGSAAIIGLLFITFPLVFSSITTDYFSLPKQAVLAFAVLVLVLLFGIKTALQKRLVFRRTSFDLPIVIFVIAILLSSLFSLNKADSLASFIPLLFAAIAYFAITNNAKNEKTVFVLTSSLLVGAAIAAAVAFLYQFKIYVLPYDFTKSNLFTTFGSTLDQAFYLFVALSLGTYLLAPLIAKFRKEKNYAQSPKILFLGVTTVLILFGLSISIYQLIFVQNPIILPFATGFQTAFAAISQDSGRILRGFLFGSGYGTYLYDFTRFKLAAFNLEKDIWPITFLRSSTFVLELLATTGILGILSFLLLVYKILKARPFFIPLLLIFVGAFLLPFSYTLIVLMFIILGLYAAICGLSQEHKYFDVEIQLVALRKGVFAFSQVDERNERGISPILSYVVLTIVLVLVALAGFVSFNYLNSDVIFQKSLVAASQNNGGLTYTLQNQAIGMFQYSDTYNRIFSQTNLALANSLAASVPQGATVSAQTQQTIYTLIQQSINAGRQATIIAPQNATDWQNLSSIYRSLIGFGQNADQFAVASAQQAVVLDPNNPQEYINLGGIYYQLGLWDNALAQFQQAVTLKPDYPNAYYNLGHTLIQKGDLKNALVQFQTVKSLVVNDPTNLAKINGEIDALQNQINQAQNPQPQTNPTTNSTLNVNTPPTTLPPQNPPVKIPAPLNSSGSAK
jgi:tetratricopeptide (TPR) repeat protein